VLLECRQGLLAQGNAVDQEKDTFIVSRPHEHIDQSNGGPGFTSARGHDQEKITLFQFDGFKYDTDGADVIIPAGDIGVDQFIGQRFSMLANKTQTFQVVKGGKADNLSRRAILQIPKVNFKVVGIKAKR
jgi:hypothetical protein